MGDTSDTGGKTQSEENRDCINDLRVLYGMGISSVLDMFNSIENDKLSKEAFLFNLKYNEIMRFNTILNNIQSELNKNKGNLFLMVYASNYIFPIAARFQVGYLNSFDTKKDYPIKYSINLSGSQISIPVKKYVNLVADLKKVPMEEGSDPNLVSIDSKILDYYNKQLVSIPKGDDVFDETFLMSFDSELIKYGLGSGIVEFCEMIEDNFNNKKFFKDVTDKKEGIANGEEILKGYGLLD